MIDLKYVHHGEFEICKSQNIIKDKILITGVYKSAEMIENTIKNEPKVNHFSVESIEQFKILNNVKKEQPIKLMLRLTSGNQFGINKEEIEEIIKNYKNYENIEIIGIQYFSGTQKTSIKNLQKEIIKLDEFVQRLKEEYNFNVQEIEFGPGFPVYYFQNSEFDEESFLKEFSNLINQIKYKGKLILELGRSIVASSGVYISKVVDKKINKGQKYAILDGGINHISYYGQSMAMKIPKCEVYPERKNDDDEKWNLCGSLCTINDILVKQFPVSNLQLGDIFIFKNTGAYCMTEGISLFLSRDLPMIIKIKEDKKIEIIRKNIPTYKLNM